MLTRINFWNVSKRDTFALRKVTFSIAFQSRGRSPTSRKTANTSPKKSPPVLEHQSRKHDKRRGQSPSVYEPRKDTSSKTSISSKKHSPPAYDPPRKDSSSKTASKRRSPPPYDPPKRKESAGASKRRSPSVYEPPKTKKNEGNRPVSENDCS
jgi:hypothetical protein